MGKVFKKLRYRYQKLVRGAGIKGKSTAPPGIFLRQAFWHPKGEISINCLLSAVRCLVLKIGSLEKFGTLTAAAAATTMVNDGPPLLRNEDAEARDENFVRVVYQCLLPRRRSFDPGYGSGHGEHCCGTALNSRQTSPKMRGCAWCGVWWYAACGVKAKIDETVIW